jgi:hypothetical protein
MAAPLHAGATPSPEPAVPDDAPINRRASRRLPLSRSVRVECRKGSSGLGRNLAVSPLDLSETGVRLVLGEALTPGQDAEVLILGGAGRLKRAARVAWCRAAEGGHLCGLRFDQPVPYADLQALAAAPRVLR